MSHIKRAISRAASASASFRTAGRFSLRSVAKRASVSHAAPAHHFSDTGGLLTALATEGFRRFLETQAAREGQAACEPSAQLLAAGLGYVDFALARPALFRLMFGSDRADFGDPAARERLLRAAREANANLVTLTGDTHNAWAFQLAHGGEAAGVEFAGQSVTSPGFEGTLGKLPPTDLAASLVRHNPQLAWTDTSRRGYMAVELTPQRAICEWRFTPTVRQRSAELAGTHRMSATAGANRFDTT